MGKKVIPHRVPHWVCVMGISIAISPYRDGMQFTLIPLAKRFTSTVRSKITQRNDDWFSVKSDLLMCA